MTDKNAQEIKRCANHLADFNEQAIYAALGNPNISQEAKDELYGIVDDVDELKDRLYEARILIKNDD